MKEIVALFFIGSAIIYLDREAYSNTFPSSKGTKSDFTQKYSL